MLCVSITEKTVEDCIMTIQSSEADLFEHRIDFLDSVQDLGKMYLDSERPIIATCRPASQGGHFTGTETERIGLLLEALNLGASYVDIEIETLPLLQDIFQDAITETGARLILSKHFYHSTPPISVLEQTLTVMQELGADLAKIVTMASSISDCLAVLQLYTIAPKWNPQLLSFAMGDLAKFTRVCALLAGAPFMYVAQDHGKAAASGQIPISKMRKILEALE
jgi:3-dehydroquinate dehydratase-1